MPNRKKPHFSAAESDRHCRRPKKKASQLGRWNVIDTQVINTGSDVRNILIMNYVANVTAVMPRLYVFHFMMCYRLQRMLSTRACLQWHYASAMVTGHITFYISTTNTISSKLSLGVFPCGGIFRTSSTGSHHR